MIKIDKVNLRMCKYRIDKLILTIKGVSDPFTVEPLAIGDINIAKDFDQYQYPFFRLIINVPNKIYRAMRKNYNDITAYVRMTYAYFKTEETVGIGDQNPPEHPYITDNFLVFMDDATPQVNTEVQETVEEAVQPDDITYDPQNNTACEILLYRQNDLNIVKKTPTAVFHNVNLMDALAYYTNMIGMKNILCSPPNNNQERYTQFIIPPIRADEQILRICCDYGIHKCGTTLFFDFDKVYIVEKVNKCTAWVKNEYKTIYIVNPTLDSELTTIIQGCSYESSDHCGYCTMSNAQAVAASMEREQSFGAGMKVLDKKTGDYITISPKGSYVKGGGGDSRTMTLYEGEQYTASALKQRLEEEGLVLNVTLDGVDLTMLAPNKMYQLYFMTSKLSKYNGAYRLTKYECTFNAKDGQWFTPTALATFVGKVPNPKK